MSRIAKAAPRRALGIAAVEMAIVLPIVALLIMPVGELGRAFIQYSRLSHRVHAGARYVADNAYTDGTGIPKSDPAIILKAQNLVVFGSTAGGTTEAVPDLQIAQVVIGVDPISGMVTVSVDYPYQSAIGGLLPLPNLEDSLPTGTLVLRPRAVMRAL